MSDVAMNTFSFWEKDAFWGAYDLIIVGAGIVGLSSALFFKRSHPEKSVLVLERGQLPGGASTRNAGFACIGSITEHQSDLEKTSEDQVKNRIKRRFEGLRLLKRTLGKETIGYEPCGGFELFLSEGEFEKAVTHISCFNQWLEQLTGGKKVYTAQKLNGYPVIHNRLEGALHPGRMMKALIRRVQDAGVEIRWNAPVQKLEETGELLLENGWHFDARQILVATNGFAKRLIPELKVVPGRGYVFVTNPVENLPWKGTFHHDRGYTYFRNIGNRLLLGGARNLAEQEEQTDQFGANTKIKDYLIHFASDVLKLPKEWKIEHEWSGIMGFTDTKTPIIKKLDERISVAVGLSGMGVAIGMEVGKEAAKLVS